MNDDDIRLLTELLEWECGRRIYNDERFSHYKHFKAEYDHMQEMSKIYLDKVPYSRLRGVGSLFFAPVLIPYILIRYGKK